MALIPKVEPKQEKKVVSARLDEETHSTLQQYAAFLGGATHEHIIGESLKRLFRRDKEFINGSQRTKTLRQQWPMLFHQPLKLTKVTAAA